MSVTSHPQGGSKLNEVNQFLPYSVLHSDTSPGSYCSLLNRWYFKKSIANQVETHRTLGFIEEFINNVWSTMTVRSDHRESFPTSTETVMFDLKLNHTVFLLVLILTDVTVCSWPTGKAVTQISSNQITAGAGIDTHASLTFISV